MNINCVKVMIQRDKMTLIPKTLRPWDVPVVSAQWGDDSVEVGDEVPEELDSAPVAEEEYQRLLQNCGVDPETKQAYVDVIYGRGGVGIAAIEKAIKAALKAGKANPAEKPVVAEKPSVLTAEEAADPLAVSA